MLKPQGALFLNVLAIFPRYHDQRWRFMPDGLSLLLSGFSSKEIVPEGGSIASLFRLLNLFVEVFVLETFVPTRAQRLVERLIYPVLNTLGGLMDAFSHGNSRFTTNYSWRAQVSGPGPQIVGGCSHGDLAGYARVPTAWHRSSDPAVLAIAAPCSSVPRTSTR